MSALCGICAGLTVVVVIITSALLGVSWQPVSPQQWGIAYNSITMTVDAATVYSAGRFYVGVGGSFFIFPRVAQYAEFVDANSLDGSSFMHAALLGGGRCWSGCERRHALRRVGRTRATATS